MDVKRAIRAGESDDVLIASRGPQPTDGERSVPLGVLRQEVVRASPGEVGIRD
jgi:hypothetical protein